MGPSWCGNWPTRGSVVRIVDNLVNGRRENLDGVLGDNVELVVADVRDAKSMATAASRCRYRLPSRLPGSAALHSFTAGESRSQRLGDARTAERFARAIGVKRFVYVSSSEVYGTARTAPITEDHPTLPMTVYGASKLAGEAYTRAFWETYRYPTVVLRPFNAYGPRCHHEGDSGEVIPKFMLRCLAGKPMIIFGDGTQTRDFTFVSDTAGWNSRRRTFHISPSDRPSIWEAAKKFRYANWPTRRRSSGPTARGHHSCRAPSRRRAATVGRQFQGEKAARVFNPPSRFVTAWRVFAIGTRARASRRKNCWNRKSCATGSRGTSPPMPKDFVPVARPHLGPEEVSAAGRAILSGWVTQGPEVAAFEREFAAVRWRAARLRGLQWHHRPSPRSAGVGVRPGDEVITVSHSYIATANSIRYCGAVPVFVDIDPATFNIDPRKIEPAISARTRAILCVHQMGMPCDLKAILEIARQHNFPSWRMPPARSAARCLAGSSRAGPVGEDWQAARRCCVLLVPSPQAVDHGRRRHVDYSRCGNRLQVSSLAATWHEHARYGAAFVARSRV